MNVAQETYRPNPRSRANFLSILCFGYTFEMFKIGCMKGLKVQDLYNPLEEDSSSALGDRLQRNWENQLTKARPSLFKAIAATFWYKFVITCFMIGTHDLGIKVYHVFMLEGLLNHFSPNSESTWKEAMYYAGLLSLLNCIALVVINHYSVEVCRVGMQVRVATCALMYRKALKLSHGLLGCTRPGKMVNLLSNDVSRFDSVPMFLNQLWTVAVSFIVLSILLYREAKLSGIAGIIIFLVFLPSQKFLGQLSAKYRRETSLKTDERVRLMDELISGIRVIKMYTWEKALEKIIHLARKTEMKFIMKAAYIRATFLVFNLGIQQLTIFATFITMVLSGTPITAVKVYVIMNYYTMMIKNMGGIFTRGFSEFAEFCVGIEKIQDFLMSEEHKESLNEDEKTNSPEKSLYDFGSVVILKNLTVKWNSYLEDTALDNINLNVPEASLLGIVGPVGSGKSSLLHTILGELKIVTGFMRVRGTISYASQDPWIFCATIRQNIIFGQEYDKNRYREVIQVCALDRDLEQFENGDLTMVGDRGASLSGGQKARINLARAVYRNADIYLLDDPLSAVDIHVSKHLYHECINTFLAKKIRILVTHQVHYLKNADQIIILKDGRVEVGSTNSKTNRALHKSIETKHNNNFMSRSSIEGVEVGSTDIETNHALHMSIETKHNNNIVSRSSIEEKTPIKMNKKSNCLGGSPEMFYPMNFTTNNKDDSKEALLMKNFEESSEGKVSGSLFFKYINAGGNVCFIGLLFVLSIAFHVIGIGWSYFTTYWLNIEEIRKPDDWSSATLLIIYGVFLLTSLIAYSLRTFLFFKLTIESSNEFHRTMFNGVIHAPMRFFDSNPGGRILNRFSKDLGLVDEFLPKNLLDAILLVFLMVSGVILMVIVDPYVLVMIAFLGVVFGALRYIYSSSSKDLRRLEGITKSPVFTHLRATLEGLTTIRASGAEDILIDEFDKHQDLHSGAWYMFLSANGAFGFYLDIVSSMFLGVLTFSFLLFERSSGMTGAEIGLLISQATTITSMVQWTMNMTAEVANELMGVERVLEYEGLPKEIQPKIPKSVSPGWPSKGEIIFEKMGLRYYEGGPLVLKHINLVIKPKEKIGVVGRTGAGKSSLISALFRLSPVEGTMKIDQQNTKLINLDVLRSKISIIPQDPVLFSGTLRYNLDPLEEYTDEDLYRAIEDVKLKDPSNVFNRLENRVMDKGLNYSVGQRQLICLARAILKNNKILLLDEATANVDPQTDAMIQETIRKKFVDCSVLTVAHRLMSVMDSDKILVMDDGSVAEFDHPHLLLQNTGGLFYKMVEDTGISEQLRKIAADHYRKGFVKPEWL